jgi:uncharacterized protein involved in exopolysaccharide biosynthesis
VIEDLPVAVATEERDDDIDLRAVGGTLWARRSWVVLSAVLFTIPFVIAAFLTEPLYRASTVLADARADTSVSSLSAALGQLGNLANVARINVPGATAVDEAMAVVRSREFTESFIRDEHMIPDLFPELWDSSKGEWRVAEAERPTLAQAYRVFNSIRTITQAGRGGLVTVDVEWRDPVKAAEWANAVVDRLNGEMRSRAISSTNLSVSYLEKELALTSNLETRQAINRLMETQINQRMLANVTLEYAFRIVDKALPPEPDDAVGPSKIVLIALGPSVGLIFGIFVVLVVNAFRGSRTPGVVQ